ncbi:putative 2 iron, 2 sulfur cluster binding protein [Thermochaetoides thermophila DSM 1495]|uniref:Putative 2 iron, 2 sulfur cluster binding protein n=1 Tax=Chaetomium thermophilum (strain DSM 1495 / CBS 144.50 / IMI 039719) TaxID=759272 RepID=G0S5P6_CHATD|nr:putative 2 iron, 2 sulfur cluster binding protein [Thermochaetoides thermophila DSM 1495]EGS20665.1 putative 2 iron, 2 sulfur cluster binding protein [Thermochaetoides thermophila DSM 1495]
MATSRTFAQALPSLGLAATRTPVRPIAQYLWTYTTASAALRLSSITRGSQLPMMRRQIQMTRSLQQTRAFSASAATSHGHIEPPKPGEELWVTFIDKEGNEHKLAVKEGDNLLDIAQAHDLEMEGACGGSCACSTCHVIVLDQEYYDRMPEPDDDENDMLDLAFGLQETSRLGCQVHMTKDLDGLRVKLPAMTRNLQASDFK